MKLGNLSIKRKRSISTTIAVVVVIIVIIIAVAAVAFTLSSSKTSTVTSTVVSTSSGKTNYLIYFYMESFDVTYFTNIIDGANYAASQFNNAYPNMTVSIVSFNGQDDPALQTSQIQDGISVHPAGMIVDPVTDSVSSAVSSALAAGIPVGIVDRGLANQSGTLFVATSNQTAYGQMIAETAMNKMKSMNIPTPWNVVSIQGTIGSPTNTERNNGILSVLNAYAANGTIKIVSDSQSGQWLEQPTVSVMSALLAQSKNINLVITSNGPEGEGVATAITQAGLTPGKNIYIVSGDGGAGTYGLISSGQILASVDQEPYVMGYWGTIMLMNYVLHNITPPTYLVPTAIISVDSTNVAHVGPYGEPLNVTAVPPPPLPQGYGPMP